MIKHFTLFTTLFLLLMVTAAPVQAQTQCRFYTSMGEFDVQLFDSLVPITANNFITLADTTFYDGVIWHRVVHNFVIQSGDPTGTGSGGPGYTIPDEFHPTLRHYKKGILSMANAGPNTGGSQFFITLRAALHLDNAHSVFGEVIDGIEIVDSIGNVPVNANDRPVFPPVIDSIRVLMPTSLDPESIDAGVFMGTAYPNPFTEGMWFTYGLAQPENPEMWIFDQTGRKMKVLQPGLQSAGDHRVHWNGTDEAGKVVPAGLYIYQLRVGNFVKSRLIWKK